MGFGTEKEKNQDYRGMKREFSKWLSLAFKDVLLTSVKRGCDDKIGLIIEQIAFFDETKSSNFTVYGNHQLLISNITIEKLSNIKPESPKYDNTLAQTTVNMSSIHVNFMPKTINQIIKFMMQNKYLHKPKCSQKIAAEYDLQVPKFVEIDMDDTQSSFAVTNPQASIVEPNDKINNPIQPMDQSQESPSP